MKMIKNLVFGVCAAAVTLGNVWAQVGLPGEDQEVWGTVRLWAPSAQRIEVDGQAYRLASGVQVVDRNTRLLPLHQVRPGVPVMLLTNGQHVTHVVVKPGKSSPFDKVGR